MTGTSRADLAAFLPSAQQELLLKACLFDGDEALAAWRAWRACADLDRLDPGSIRLLPLLADRLVKLGVDDAWFGAYRGVQRRTWARNLLLLRGAGEVIGRLRAAGVTVMPLKGLVLATSCYETMSLRPMGDFDLLIRQGEAETAFDALEDMGWRLQPPSARPRTRADFAVRHSCVYEDPANAEVSVDLHWRLLWGRHSPQAEDALWSRATPFSVGGQTCLAPSAADLLLHVCAHGARWNDVPPQRWVADAVLLLRTCEVDWDHLCDQAERLRLGPPLVDTLGYLQSVMGAPAPQAALARLARTKTRPIDRFFYEVELRPPRRRSLFAALRLHLHIARSHLAASDGLAAYWRYLQAVRAGRGPGKMIAWALGRLLLMARG